ncbi:hypothetical protein CHARACLAT_015446 [Characodon lateralis]|uniref:Uncharacterized protein n=1 Tax=Characodon lateralis TaxID=208331 RepID=A0ABU7EAL3_9TELE|nr:hypothetical protein [Characodon lateralis]
MDSQSANPHFLSILFLSILDGWLSLFLESLKSVAPWYRFSVSFFFSSSLHLYKFSHRSEYTNLGPYSQRILKLKVAPSDFSLGQIKVTLDLKRAPSARC